jgi:hypothetical protein
MTWWLGYPDAQTTIQCGKERHRLRWHEGTLQVLDHENLEDERTLAALGGQRNKCVDVADAWARNSGNLRLVTAAGRGPTDTLALGATPPTPTAHAGGGRLFAVSGRARARGWTSYGGVAQVRGTQSAPAAPSSPEDDLVMLLGLGGGVADRVVATILATWADRLREPTDETRRARPQVYAAVYGRVVPALRGWLGRSTLDVSLELVDEDAKPTLAEEDGTLRAELPFSWLPRVWARGLATVFGRFCLDAETTDGAEWTLTAVGPALGPTTQLRLDLGDSS